MSLRGTGNSSEEFGGSTGTALRRSGVLRGIMGTGGWPLERQGTQRDLSAPRELDKVGTSLWRSYGASGCPSEVLMDGSLGWETEMCHQRDESSDGSWGHLLEGQGHSSGRFVGHEDFSEGELSPQREVGDMEMSLRGI